MNENDDLEEEEDNLDISAIQDWTFTKLTDMGETYTEITEKNKTNR